MLDNGVTDSCQVSGRIAATKHKWGSPVLTQTTVPDAEALSRTGLRLAQ
jgi:hypothetical protein